MGWNGVKIAFTRGEGVVRSIPEGGGLCGDVPRKSAERAADEAFDSVWEQVYPFDQQPLEGYTNALKARRTTSRHPRNTLLARRSLLIRSSTLLAPHAPLRDWKLPSPAGNTALYTQDFTRRR